MKRPCAIDPSFLPRAAATAAATPAAIPTAIATATATAAATASRQQETPLPYQERRKRVHLRRIYLPLLAMVSRYWVNELINFSTVCTPDTPQARAPTVLQPYMRLAGIVQNGRYR